MHIRMRLKNPVRLFLGSCVGISAKPNKNVWGLSCYVFYIRSLNLDTLLSTLATPQLLLGRKGSDNKPARTQKSTFIFTSFSFVCHIFITFFRVLINNRIFYRQHDEQLHQYFEGLCHEIFFPLILFTNYPHLKSFWLWLEKLSKWRCIHPTN